MGDLLEVVQLPLEAYPEYPVGLVALFRDSPLVMWAYVVIAFPIAGLVVYLLSKKPITFGRTYLQCAVVAVVVLPGAIALGGVAFVPLALVLAISFVSPSMFLYNLSLLLVAAAVAWVAARLAYRWRTRAQSAHVV